MIVRTARGVVGCVSAAVCLFTYSSAWADGPFKVLDASSGVIGTYDTLQAAYDATPNKGTIELQSDATFSGKTCFDSTGSTSKTLTITSSAGKRFRLKRASDDAAIYICTVNTTSGANVVMTISNVILDGGAVWASDTVTDLTNSGVKGDDHFFWLQGGSKAARGQLSIGANVVAENFNGGNGTYLFGMKANGQWYAYIKVTASDFVVRNNRGGPLFCADQNQTLEFMGTLTNCYSATHLFYKTSNTASIKFKSPTLVATNVVGTYVVHCYKSTKDADVTFGDAAPSKIFIWDNFRADGTTRADCFRSDSAGGNFTVAKALTADSRIGLWKPASPATTADIENTMALKTTYVKADANPGAFVWDGSPAACDGNTYIGRIDGDYIIWSIKGKNYDFEQDEVFRVSNDGGETWTKFSYLEKACDALAAGGIIELTDNALFNAHALIDVQNVTIRSQPPHRYELKRVNQSSIKIGTVAQADCVFTNVVLDGGAVWTDPDDLTSLANTGVGAMTFIQSGINGSASYSGTTRFAAGCEIRNVHSAGEGMIVAGTSRNNYLDKGASIHDCRGVQVVGVGWSSGKFTLAGGDIYRCYSSASIFERLNSGQTVVYLQGGAITNNMAVSQVFSGSSDPTYKISVAFGGNVPLIVRDNVTVKGLPIGIAPNDPSCLKVNGNIAWGSQVDVVPVGDGSAGTLLSSSAGDYTGAAGLRNYTNVLMRAVTEEGSLYWRQAVVLDDAPVPLASGTTVSGALHVFLGSTSELDRSVDYTLFTGENLSGAFDPVTIVPEVSSKWRVKCGSEAIWLHYAMPGLLLIFR